MAASPFEIPVEDQFGSQVGWSRFSKVPRVLVIAGKDAAEGAKDWGLFVQQTFNENFQPSSDHLQNLSPKEKVKVIGVVALPDVPSMFKGLFRRGFRKEVPNMGMALDFGSQISKHFNYENSQPDPMVVILAPGSNEVSESILGSVNRDDLKTKLAARLRSYL